MKLEVLFVQDGGNDGYLIGVYERYTDTLYNIRDKVLEQGLRDNKYVVDKIQLKDNKIDLTKALEFNPNNRAIVYKQSNEKCVHITDVRLVRSSIYTEMIKKSLDEHSIIDIRPKVTKEDQIKLTEIAKEYDEFLNMTRLLGKDTSFKYAIVSGKCILTEYTGTSKEFNVPNFVDYITSRAFDWCDDVNLKAAESLKGIGRICNSTGEVTLASNTFITQEILMGK